MKMLFRALMMGVLALLAVAGLLAACTSPSEDYQAAAAERAPPPRPVPAGHEAFRPVPAATPLAPARFEYGEGDCETRYADGTRGTCINGKACNGFGFRNARGELVCACFERIGGCDETQACSSRRRQCVARGEIDLQRPVPRSP